MPAFDFPTLAWWGLPLVAAPLLIHLINLLRHRRVRFAAMELLLASQKKYRTRVLLRQLLLLALRTTAIAGLVLALAEPRWRSAVGGLFGRGGLHVIVLDDSISMGDKAGGEDGAATAFARGRRAAERIAADAAARGDEVAVGLFSQLAGDPAAMILPRGPATAEAVRRVAGELERTAPSWLATGPREPLTRAAALAAESGARGGTLWLVSDFRLEDWQDEASAAALAQAAEAGLAVRLVDCGRDSAAAEAPANLTITRLEAAGGVPAVGVLVPVEMEIRNDGPGVARDVVVELREDDAQRPGLQIAEIPPGGTVSRRFDARFTTPGCHVVEARLPPDRLPADGIRCGVIDVVDHADVLLVADDDAAGPGGDAFHVATALAPGASAATGLRPRTVAPAALGAMDLAAYDVIWVLDVTRLDAAAITALEDHAAAGGGVVFFCGPRTRVDFVNRALHRGGEGLFPVPLAGSVEVLPATGAGRVPDIVAEPHPVVAVLSGSRNPLLDAVRVERVMAVERDFDEQGVRGLRRLLSLRDGAPLAVERPFGTGLVAAVLTSAAPTWNNWARGNPSWVVVMLELQSHAARQRRRGETLRVGEAMRVMLTAGEDAIEVDFIVPPDGAVVRQMAQATARESIARSRDAGFEARLPTTMPGAYAARWRRVDGSEQERMVAVTIDTAEGLLERAGFERLARQLAGTPFTFTAAESLDPGGTLAGVPLARPLLLGLLAVLVLEQLAARAASYQAVPVRRRR